MKKYLYGSQVYGTANKDSDYDYVIVGSEKELGDKTNGQEVRDGLNNFHYYTNSHWAGLIAKQHIVALECLAYSKETFELDFAVLRSSFSEKASNSFVKAKKKLTVEQNQQRIGYKSLWHSIRIIDFGCQLVTHGTIVDFSSCNNLYRDIVYTNKSWEDLSKIYKPLYNAKKTEFKLLLAQKG